MWEFIYGTIALSIIAVFRQSFSTLARSAVSYVFCTTELELGYTQPLECYFKDNLSRSRIGNRVFSVGKVFVNPNNRIEAVGYEQFASCDTVSLYWLGLMPFLVKYGTTINNGNRCLSVNFIKGTLDIEKLIIDSLDYYNDIIFQSKDKDRYKVMRVTGASVKTMDEDSDLNKKGNGLSAILDSPLTKNKISILTDCDQKKFLKWKAEDLTLKNSVNSSCLQDLSLKEHVLSAVDEIRRWKKSKDWYQDRHISWKRGWVLHGKPGTGKTSISKALAKDLKIPLVILDMRHMDGSLLQHHWEYTIAKESPCIVLIEDIDTIFDKREPVKTTLSFDILLNCLDGAVESEGVFTIITTNKLEKLDEALGGPDSEGNFSEISNRPGRVDRLIEMDILDEPGRLRLARRILKGYPDSIKFMVEEGKGDSGAQFQERCSRIALDLYWGENESI